MRRGQRRNGRRRRRVLLEHLGEESDSVHRFDVAMPCTNLASRANIYTGKNERSGSGGGKNGVSVAVRAQRNYLSSDANALGNLFGGRLMQYIDLVGAMAASRHAKSHHGDGEHGPSGLSGSGSRRGSSDPEGQRESGVHRPLWKLASRRWSRMFRHNRMRHVSSAYLTYSGR